MAAPITLTPNIDSIASNGASCTNGYVTHPFCSPSRAALLTGRYQQRFGHESQPADDATNPRLGLPMQEILLPQPLKPAGYVCGLIGKWHLGSASNFHPLAREVLMSSWFPPSAVELLQRGNSFRLHDHHRNFIPDRCFHARGSLFY